MHTVNTTSRVERRYLHVRVGIEHLEHHIDAFWAGMGYSIAYPGQTVRLSFLLEEAQGQEPTWHLHAALSASGEMRTFCNRSADTVRGHLMVGENGLEQRILPEDYIAMHRKGMAEAVSGGAALDLLSGLHLHATFAYYNDEDGPDQAWFAARGWAPIRLKDNGWDLDMVLSRAASKTDLETDTFGLLKLAGLRRSNITLKPESQKLLTEFTAPAMASLF